MDRRTDTWFHTVHEHVHEADIGPTWLQDLMQRGKMIIAMIQSQALHLQSLERTVTFNTIILLTLNPTIK